jgi:hypothetical protein
VLDEHWGGDISGTEGKPLPNELRKEEAQLRHEIELEDDNTAVPRTHIDDEYAHASEQDPKVRGAQQRRLLSMSRRAHSRSCGALEHAVLKHGHS